MKDIIRQSEPYGFILETEVQEMISEGYTTIDITDSINELVEELEIIRGQIERGEIKWTPKKS